MESARLGGLSWAVAAYEIWDLGRDFTKAEVLGFFDGAVVASAPVDFQERDMKLVIA